MDEISRVEELEKELAHAQHELELYKNPDVFLFDKYDSAPYWRERCLRAENELGVLKVIHADLRNQQAR